jgi:hypothetical protein
MMDRPKGHDSRAVKSNIVLRSRCAQGRHGTVGISARDAYGSPVAVSRRGSPPQLPYSSGVCLEGGLRPLEGAEVG